MFAWSLNSQILAAPTANDASLVLQLAGLLLGFGQAPIASSLDFRQVHVSGHNPTKVWDFVACRLCTPQGCLVLGAKQPQAKLRSIQTFPKQLWCTAGQASTMLNESFGSKTHHKHFASVNDHPQINKHTVKIKTTRDRLRVH